MVFALVPLAILLLNIFVINETRYMYIRIIRSIAVITLLLYPIVSSFNTTVANINATPFYGE